MKISVIIPVYLRHCKSWRALMFKQALHSVKYQLDKPYEVIIAAEGNINATMRIVKEADLPVPTSVIKLNKARAPGIARNIAAEYANGNILAFLDSDDTWMPTYLRIIKFWYNNFPNVVSTYTLAVTLEDTKVIARSSLVHILAEECGYREVTTKLLFLRTFIHTASAFTVRKEIFEEIGGYYNYRHAEDLDFYIRLSLSEKIHAIPYFLVIRHMGDDNLTREYTSWFKTLIKVYKKYLLNPQIAYKNIIAYGLLRKLLRIIENTKHLTMKLQLMKTIIPLYVALRVKYGLLNPEFNNLRYLMKQYSDIIWSRILEKEGVIFLLSKTEKYLLKTFFSLYIVTKKILNIINRISTKFSANKLFCLPFSTRKSNDDRIALSLIATLFKEPVKLILYPPEKKILVDYKDKFNFVYIKY